MDKPKPQLDYVTRESIERAMPHMRTVCTRCGGEWSCVATGRSLWLRPFMGGPGRVPIVGAIYCARCDPRPELPAHGTPIYADEVCELNGLTRVWPAPEDGA